MFPKLETTVMLLNHEYMKYDHMRNAQLKPGYHVQIGVDSEYIVSADIFQNGIM